MDKPRIVYFGTPEFAAQTLEYLIEKGENIVAVVSKPDKPVGRSTIPQATPVKRIAEKYSLPLLQPDKVSAPEPSAQLETYQADLFVVVAYGEIIKQHLLDMPKIACINLHASLLPKFRGAAPIQRSIMEGEKETGVTIIHMAKQMDAGDMVDLVIVPIALEMTYGELSQALCEEGKQLLLKAIHDLAAGKAERTVQNHEQATMAPKIELEDCEVNWHQPAQKIHDQVRGTNPEPGSWCKVSYKDELKRLRIFRTRVVADREGTPGSILEWGPKRVIIATGEGSLELLEVQLEGKKAMQAADLARGIPRDAINF